MDGRDHVCGGCLHQGKVEKDDMRREEGAKRGGMK